MCRVGTHVQWHVATMDGQYSHHIHKWSKFHFIPIIQIHLKNLLQHQQWTALMPLDRAKTHQIVNTTFFTNKSKVFEQKYKMFTCQRTLACNEFIIVLCCVWGKMYMLCFLKLWETDKFLNFPSEFLPFFCSGPEILLTLIPAMLTSVTSGDNILQHPLSMI